MLLMAWAQTGTLTAHCASGLRLKVDGIDVHIVGVQFDRRMKPLAVLKQNGEDFGAGAVGHLRHFLMAYVVSGTIITRSLVLNRASIGTPSRT